MALRTVMGELMKALAERRGDYTDLTASQFMLIFCHEEGSDVFKELGVQNAYPSQLHCLANLPLTATYSCLRLFFYWVDEGFYDYSALPFPFKVHLSEQDKLALELDQLTHKWSGTNSVLMKELEQLINALKQSEKDIASEVNGAINVSF